MIITLSLIILLSMAVWVFFHQPKFGKQPSGERLEKIKKSPNYKDNSFHNLSPTPVLSPDANLFTVSKEFFFGKKVKRKPVNEIPSIKTDLWNLDPNKTILVWFGHSSYFMQIDGKKILVDPVLSGSVSPVSFVVKAFKGTDPYTADDIPEIDYLFISHDHWDHLDYETILKLKPKIKKVICGLGTAEHLEYWGYNPNIIIEKDWNEKIMLDAGFTVYTVPARHFSGRGFLRNKSLWSSFVLQTPTSQIFIGGDSGYDNHFAKTGNTFGAFDLVILENGQYNKNWKHIHMMPREVLQAAKDLRAKSLFPVHSSKFALAHHEWDEPLRKITELNKDINLQILTPKIGEQVDLKDHAQKFSKWWENI